MTTDKQTAKPEPQALKDGDLDHVQAGGMIGALGKMVGGLGKLVGKSSSNS